MKQRLFLLLMLLSGFAGISYEILYGRMLGNLIGDQFAVSAAVLITFLLGIALGSRYAWRLWSWLWLIELLIGGCGIAFVLGHDALDSLLYSSLPWLPSGLSGSIIACVALLLLPAFLIGCSVPLFAGYMSRLSGGEQFSRVYALYNVAAAITALAIEFLLLRSFGIQATVLCFAALNVLIAALLLTGFRPASRPLEAMPASTERIWLALIPISMASAVFQLLMVKLAEMLLGPFRESFALVLSIVLLGIAVGAMLVHRLHISFRTVVWMALAGLLLFLLLMEPVAYLYADLYAQAAGSYWIAVLLKWVCLFLLMGLAAVAFGATVPALISAEHEGERVSQESGQLLFVASMANVAGFLLMVFVLHRYLDYGVIVLVIALLAAFSLFYPLAGQRRVSSLLVAAMLLLTATGVYAVKWNEDLLYISYTNFRDVDDLDQALKTSVMPEKFKGYQDVFAINWVDGSPYFFINGYNSIPLNNPSERIVGAVSSYYAPRTADALVLGLGSGATASVVGQLFTQTDVVEINPVVRENLFRMRQWNFNIEANPRVHIMVDDAIHYTRAAEKQYDLILNTVTTPLYFSSSKLYTRDFFTVVKDRLKADGIYVTWMDARVGDKGVDIILNTIKASFKHCALLYIKSSYFLLVASDQPIRAHALPHFAPGNAAYDSLLAGKGIVPEWLKYQLISADVLPLLGDYTLPLNEADFPALEFEMARLSGRGIADFKARLRAAMDVHALRPALGATSDQYPAELFWHTDWMLGDASFTRRWRVLAASGVSFTTSLRTVQQQHYRHLLAGGADADVVHRFAYRLMRLGQYQDALPVLQHVLALVPDHDDTHFNMAACYEYLGQYKAALKHYRMEAAVDPADEDVPYRLGRVYVKMQQYPAALEQLQRAITVMAGGAGAKVYDYLAQAYTGLGQVALAEQAAARANALRR